MRVPYFVGALTLLAAVVVAGYVTRDFWRPGLGGPDTHPSDGDPQPAVLNAPKLLKLTPEARKNLSLSSQPVQLQDYWRTIEVPGVIVDRPGQSDRVIVSPAAAVVVGVFAFPGDLMNPGTRLFTLRLIGEQALTTQADLIKTVHEMQFVKEQRTRLEELKKTTLVPEPRFFELDTQAKRFAAASQAYRQELLSRGLTSAQVERVAAGTFVTEIEVTMPAPAVGDKEEAATHEVEQLKVELGQQVNAGQVLCLLSDHREVYIEGHSFKREAPYLERATQNAWPIRLKVSEDEASAWPPLPSPLAIRHLSNTVDPTTRTFSFFVPITNQWRTYEKDGRPLRVWRFRPGQRVHLQAPVEKYKDVIVLTAAAVAREWPDAYVFRQNGDLFERRAVHVLFEDQVHIVIANDGAIQPGLDYIAQSAGASLNRILKAQSSGGSLPPGAHFHADGSLHLPGK